MKLNISKQYKVKAGKLIVALLILKCTFFYSTAFSQVNRETNFQKDKDEKTQTDNPYFQSTRGYETDLEKRMLATGKAKYLRFVNHDGNLVTGGVVNTVLLAYHYVSGSDWIKWPKGSQAAEYLHSGVFFVAAEVVDVNGDTIHIVSDNYRRSNSETSIDYTHMYSFNPLPKYYNHDEPGAQETPLVYGVSEDVGLDGIPNSFDSGEGDGILQLAEDFNGNGVLDLSMKNNIGWFAISHKKETWPRWWPAGSYPGDDRAPGEEREGPRAGRWNGEFGAYIRASQESYYVADDSENDEFEYYPFDDDTPWPNCRRGLGITVESRNYQWNARLAEDIFISIYDVTNHGKDLNKCVVGMYVDSHLGRILAGTKADFDRRDDITYTWRIPPVSWQGFPLGYFGFAFLESPGLAEDGLDNDQDGMIDESQNNGFDDDFDWTAWEDQNGNGTWDNEDVNYNGELDNGEDSNNNGRLDFEPLYDDLGADGLGPEFNEYTGPDVGEANGLPDEGEPNFEFADNDESDQIGLTSWYLRDVDNTMANDDLYWNVEIYPGTFNIRPGQERDPAWTYGSGFVQFAGIERTHRYAIALLYGNDFDDIFRNKRTMQVIYDNDYNFSKPPIQPILSATGGDKKAYLNWDSAAERSRDPIYGRDFEAYYIYKSTEPSFGDIKTITDAFANPLLFETLAIFDKKDSLKGVHPVRIGSELGPESDLGISYNMGKDSGLRHTFLDTNVVNGRTYYYAVASVDRGYHPDFYPDITDREGLALASPTECGATILTDPLGRPISFDPNTAAVTPSERPAGWVKPKVSDTGIEHIAGSATGDIYVEVYNPLEIKPNHRYKISFNDDGSFEKLDSLYTGFTNAVTISSALDNNIVGYLADPDNNEYADEFVNDGFKVKFENDSVKIDTTFWETGNSAMTIKDMTVELRGKAIPRNYEVRVKTEAADTSVNGNKLTNFQIWDVTDENAPFKMAYRFTDRSEANILDENDRIILVNNRVNKKHLWKWDFVFPSHADSSVRTTPQEGDVLKIFTTKSFDRNDIYEFTMVGNDINSELLKNELDDIYTVPDPYIAVSKLERQVTNPEEGRGDRRIDFVNLPQSCTISIFTASGRLVRKLEHSSGIEDTRATWDLRTKEGLEIAFGVYFYVVEAPGIGIKRGRLAIIK
jgi:hypothetical protein